MNSPTPRVNRRVSSNVGVSIRSYPYRWNTSSARAMTQRRTGWSAGRMSYVPLGAEIDSDIRVKSSQERIERQFFAQSRGIHVAWVYSRGRRISGG